MCSPCSSFEPVNTSYNSEAWTQAELDAPVVTTEDLLLLIDERQQQPTAAAAAAVGPAVTRWEQLAAELQADGHPFDLQQQQQQEQRRRLGAPCTLLKPPTAPAAAVVPKLDAALVTAALRPLLLPWQQPNSSSSSSFDDGYGSSACWLPLSQRVALARQFGKSAGLHRIQTEQVCRLLGKRIAAAAFCHVSRTVKLHAHPKDNSLASTFSNTSPEILQCADCMPQDTYISHCLPAQPDVTVPVTPGTT